MNSSSLTRSTSPLIPATDLNALQITGTHQGVCLGERDVQFVGYVLQRQEPVGRHHHVLEFVVSVGPVTAADSSAGVPRLTLPAAEPSDALPPACHSGH